MSAPRDARALWFTAVLIVLAGWAFGFRADESRIADRVDDERRLRAQLAAAERTLSTRPALERERATLRARLRRVDLEGDRTTAVARFVRDAAAVAARHRTTIAAIAAVGSARTAAPPVTSAAMPSPRTAPASTALQAPADAFEAIALDLTVEGRYADLLAAFAALSSGRVPTAVEVVSLARKQAGSPTATLSAQLHVVIERLAPAVDPLTPAAATHAATRPA